MQRGFHVRGELVRGGAVGAAHALKYGVNLGSRAACGATAGVVGVATFQVTGQIERALVGGEPPYSPESIVATLSRRSPRRISAQRRRLITALLPWCYGAAWAVAYAMVRPRMHARRSARVGAFAATIAGVELATLPWLLGRDLLRPRALAALGVHVTTFALVADTTLDLMVDSSS